MKRWLGILLAICMVWATLIPAFAADSGQTEIVVKPTFGQTDARSMLDMINAFRTGDEAFYWNESNTAQVSSRGEPLAYSYALEEIAMQRAAEIALSFSHTRPDGTDCFSAEASDGSQSWGENIAAGSPTASGAFEQWREDDDDYSGQGHRRNMLKPAYKAVGIGHVTLNGIHYWAQEFGYDQGSVPQTAALDTERAVSVMVSAARLANVGDVTISPESVTVQAGERAALPTASASVRLSEAWPSRQTAVDVTPAWTSADTSVCTVDGQEVSGVAAGNTTLSATVFGKSLSVPVTVGGDGGEPVPADGVYAILYGDGTLVFQHGNTPQAGRAVTETYAVDLVNGYSLDYENWQATTPWYSARESITAVDFADTISPQSTAFWFYDCTNLAEITNLANLDTSNVTDMQYMFYNCFKLTELDVSGFDTSNVTTMSNMFVYCMWLTTLDVSGFDTSHVTDMSYMFSDCNRLTALDVSGFDTSNVTNMMYMFAYCKGLAMLDLSGFDTSHVTSMSQMFYACDGLATLDLSAFDTSRVTDMLQMFAYCNILTTIRASERFMTSQVTEGRYMFSDCTALVGGNGTQYTADHEDAEYARIDTAAAPGYFTYAAAPITPTPTPAPVSVFSAPTSHGQPITAANLATLTEITVPVQYTGDTAQSVTVAVAFYDVNGRFTGFGIASDSVGNGGKDVTVPIGGVTDAAQVKAFVLDTGLAPLCEAGAYEIPAA